MHAPVIAEVREAKLQKWVYGLGFSTDTGTRFSIDHTHNKDPFLNWRAVSKLQLDKKYPEISTRLTSLPDYSGWNYFIGGKAAREKLADYSVNNISLLAGRGKSEDKIDRNYYLQYDMAKPQGNDDLPSSSALTGNYSWTGRYFNSTLNPTRGYGFGIELGAGSTLTPDNEPFGRISARWLYFLPLSRDEETGRRSRLAPMAVPCWLARMPPSPSPCCFWQVVTTPSGAIATRASVHVRTMAPWSVAATCSPAVWPGYAPSPWPATTRTGSSPTSLIPVR